MPLGPKLLWKLTRRGWVEPSPLVMRPNGEARRDGELFLRSQGPAVDAMIDHLRAHQHDYDAIFFFTALYFPTAMGVRVCGTRAILVPTLHDERAMYLPVYHEVFRAPRLILYNTATEHDLASRLYGDGLAPGRICGVGVDVPDAAQHDALAHAWPETAHKFGIEGGFVFYLGRVEVSKGCEELFDFFLDWRRRREAPLKLVVTGQAFMPLRDDPSIVYTGFVSDDERDQLLAHAHALVVPSRFESLSLVALEAMAHGCPVIVTSGSEVLVRHVEDSGAGTVYDGFDAFAAALDGLLAGDDEARARQQAAARDYVRQRYAWPRIMDVLGQSIEEVAAGASTSTPRVAA
jgi:glycosyltransferase involved in cell wall biosynthesis